MPTVLKTFVRNGQRFKRGDDAPSDLDGPTAEHYRRHGMISAGTEPKAPARAPRRRTPPGPSETKPATPAEQQAAPTDPTDAADEAQTGQDSTPNPDGSATDPNAAPAT